MSLCLSRRTCLMLAMLWAASIITATVVTAQVRPFRMEPLPEPTVLSGADIGFRVEGTINGVPAGRLVVRTRNGEWVEPRSVSSA